VYIHRSLSASVGKRQQFFHWKTPGAGGGIANSVTVEGNFRVPATRQATTRWPTRCLPAEIRRFRNLLSLSLYRFSTLTIGTSLSKIDRHLFLWHDVDCRAPTTTTEKSLRSSPFYRKTPRGAGGVNSSGGVVAKQRQGGLGCTCTWLSIGFLPKVDSCH